MAHHSQGDLFSPIRNHGVFSSHWLEHRLSHEPDWAELADAADEALEELGELWKVQRKRVEKYGDEQGLEEGFIQHVLKALGWRPKYQTYLQQRKPDYALFLSDADLWTAEATGMPLDGVSYNEAAECVDRPGKFNPLTTRDWFMAADRLARHKLQAFHWDLAFPEVFCDEAGERAGGGFDAIIGNPPYEVLSKKESGIDPTDLKAFADSEPLYHPAIRGKQNLYKLFICRALDVLRDGGRFGFIVPMPLFGDDQAADVRRHMAKLGEFTAIEAFPQKDNPRTGVRRRQAVNHGVHLHQGAAEGRRAEVPLPSPPGADCASYQVRLFVTVLFPPPLGGGNQTPAEWIQPDSVLTSDSKSLRPLPG